HAARRRGGASGGGRARAARECGPGRRARDGEAWRAGLLGSILRFTRGDEMPQRDRSEKKVAAKRRRRKVRRPDRGEPPTKPANGDWGEIADRAAKKISELAEKARPAAERAGEAAKKMAVDLSEGVDGAFARITSQARDLMAKGQHTRVRI